MSDTSDPFDVATRIETEERERSIANARRAAELAANRPLPTECENGCGTPPRERSRYCSDECREDHSVRLMQNRRKGIR